MPEIILQNVFLVQILNTIVSILKFSYKMQENFLHTSVKCCTSAGKFPAHTVKICIFLSSAGNMIPALQPPNTGALSHGLSFLISIGTCLNTLLDTLAMFITSVDARHLGVSLSDQ